MGVADSPLRDSVVFLEGVGRSGTTWLVTLLATHPSIAGVASESHLFDQGVGCLFDNLEQPAYGSYLSSYVSREELTDLARELCDGVLMRMRERTKPGAPMVVEKTPTSSSSPRAALERKLRCYPDAWYLYLRRDEAAVRRSLLRTPFMQGRSENEVAHAVRASSEAIPAVLSGAARYRELDYQELEQDPAGAIANVLDWLQLDAGGDVLDQVRLLSAERFSKVKTVARDSPAAGRRVAAARHAARAARAVTARARPSAWRRPPRASSAIGRLVRAFQGLDQPGPSVLDEITADDLLLDLRTGSADIRVQGEEAREALRRVVAQLFGRPFVTVNWRTAEAGAVSSLLLQAVTPEATRIDVSLHAVERNGRIVELNVVSAGAVEGRPLASADRR